MIEHDKQLVHDHSQKDTNQVYARQIPRTSTCQHQQLVFMHNLQLSSPCGSSSVSRFGVVDNKLKTISFFNHKRLMNFLSYVGGFIPRYLA